MQKQTAKDTYATRQREIAALMEYLRCELESHAETTASEGAHWGHVGDVGAVRDRLKMALMSIMGWRDEEAASEMIENALADSID